MSSGRDWATASGKRHKAESGSPAAPGAQWGLGELLHPSSEGEAGESRWHK